MTQEVATKLSNIVLEDERPRKFAKVASVVSRTALEIVRDRVPNFTAAKLGMILGSGMGDIANIVENKTVIPYSDLPDFPVSTVSGHAGNLVIGTLYGMSVACLQGRVHLYEGIDPEQVKVPIFLLKMLGCEVLFMTTATGSLVQENGPGSLVTVSDHINLQARNPLIGPNDPIGTRFPSMLDAYDPKLRGLLASCAKQHDIALPEGVYLAVTGPSFETPAEIRAFKILGADVVGMSTVAECTCARFCDLRVAALAIVVNLASGMTTGHITHDETLEWSNKASGDIKKLLKAFIERQAEW